VDPIPDPLLLRKSDSIRNRPRDLWICSRHSGHYTTEMVVQLTYVKNMSVSIHIACRRQKLVAWIEAIHWQFTTQPRWGIGETSGVSHIPDWCIEASMHLKASATGHLSTGFLGFRLSLSNFWSDDCILSCYCVFLCTPLDWNSSKLSPFLSKAPYYTIRH
jgi:hypothetical protein